MERGMTYRRRRLACVFTSLALVAVSLGGCATITTFPRPFGGVRHHARLLGITKKSPGGGGGCHPYVGLDRLLYLLFFPVGLTDFAVSAVADTALAPLTVMMWWREEHRVPARPDGPLGAL
jgi:hypothetical protein